MLAGAADTLPQEQIPAGTIFDVYGAAKTLPGAVSADYGGTITATTAAGHRVVRSAGMYLDQLCDKDDWNVSNPFGELTASSGYERLLIAVFVGGFGANNILTRIAGFCMRAVDLISSDISDRFLVPAFPGRPGHTRGHFLGRLPRLGLLSA